ncbi:YdcF family protein [Maribellus mangrovi]|uniref:YdcF family protein n=1 Tax=Maribellus mangrovi TaxID=3133146 RepID=UPI0030ED2758
MAKLRVKNIYFLRLLRNFFVIVGMFFTICVLIAFTTWPYWGYHWLGTSKSELQWKPKYIVLMGGGGMPSQSNLMRSWHTANAYQSFPDSKIIIAMPGDAADSRSTPRKMEEELILRGIDPSSIILETKGTNTRSQALNCAGLVNYKTPILLVTSPEHMRRAVLCFQKVGFEKVNALPAFENAAEADFTFHDDELGGNTVLVPDVGKSMNMRYQVWNHLKYEILFVREMLALSYYKLRGWI